MGDGPSQKEDASKRYLHPNVTAALFTTAKTRSNLNVHQQAKMGKGKCGMNIHGILLCQKKNEIMPFAAIRRQRLSY